MSSLEAQIAHLENAIQTEVDVSSLHTHYARLGGLLYTKASDEGVSAKALVVKTSASLAKETDPGQRRVLEATLAAATSAAASPQHTAAPTPKKAIRAASPSKVPLVPEPSPEPRAVDDDDDDDDKKKDDDDLQRFIELSRPGRKPGELRARLPEAVVTRDPVQFVREQPAASSTPHRDSALGRLQRAGGSLTELEALYASAPRMVRG
jgi:hypothetical protein